MLRLAQLAVVFIADIFSSDGEMNEFNIVLFGASRVGKTQLASRYTQHTYTESYDATIEELYKKEAKFEGKFYSLKILDTQGIEQFKAMREIYISKADAFVIAYDVNEAASLSELDELARSILVSRGHATPMVFVGTKHDKNTASKPTTPDAIRVASRLASSLGKPHIISSAKLNYHVDSIFGALVHQRFKSDASRYRDGDAASSAMSNLSIDGWLTSKIERENGVRQQPSIKRSMVKLKRSIAKLNGSRSMRNLRKAFSTASFHRTSTSASSLTLREAAANCNRRNVPSTDPQSDIYACDPRPRADQGEKAQILLAQDEIENGENDLSLKTVTQSKLSELPQILDVSDEKSPSSRKRDGVCAIM